MKSQLTIDAVLAWCDAFRDRRGRWPRISDGPVPGADLTWCALNLALARGYRGLSGGHSLAALLRDRRGARHRTYPPRLTLAQILAWADAHHARTGDWPGHDSGPVPDTNGETWLAVETALRAGSRGLRGGSSLARLLTARRGARNHLDLPALTAQQILRWADAHYRRTGAWPAIGSGPVAGAPGESWHAVDAALLMGHRGLPRGGSLARLLAKHRGVRNPAAPPALAPEHLLAWADAHYRRTGAWPVGAGGAIDGAPGETWAAVEAALRAGLRGLPGGDSLARFLARHRGKRNPAALPRLTLTRIRGWARDHHARTGAWPTRGSGAIPGTAGETWHAVAKALERGRRGLPAGLTLARTIRRIATRPLLRPAGDPNVAARGTTG
ncbi:hypothetical protein VT84_06430 [Gemmata sp. SH-PL17]|uniref:hypothetical protein n=1 Tax=Gemmata sp. SH-PL17 TaxID=1630693 RepID=UPI00078B944E|nr:hypothetical protein [Gemmata sp. SH-PL17]AMV24013.1 hypothetical protein VT84_06430 [Gemmata sp. SH-PL17]